MLNFNQKKTENGGRLDPEGMPVKNCEEEEGRRRVQTQRMKRGNEGEIAHIKRMRREKIFT